MTEPTSKPPRSRRWAKRLIVVLTLLILAVIVTYWLGKAWLVRNRAIALLESFGLHVTDLRVTDATPWHAQIEGLVAGPDAAVKARIISIDYSPGRLFHRAVERIVITGADVDANVMNVVKTDSDGDSQAVAAPFSSIELVDSKIRFDNDVVVPLHGQVTSSDGAYRISAQADLSPKPLKVSAVAHGHDLAGSVESEALETEIVGNILHHFGINAPRMTGWTGTRIAVAQQADSRSLSVTLHPDAVTFISAAGDKYNIEHGTIEYNQGFGVAPSDAMVKLTDVNASSSSSEIFAEGISGGATIQRFSPFLTAPAQTLSVAKLTSGKVKLTDGSLVFHGDPSGDIIIESTHFAGLGGSVSSENAHIHGADADFKIVAADLSLHDLLDAFAQGRATGNGRVNATVPMQIHGGVIALGEGAAVATPGGNIQILDAKSLTDTIAAADPSFAAGGANQQLREDLPKAIADFQFQTLRADLQNGENDLRANIHLVGKGRVTLTRSYDLEFRVSPVNEAIAIGLGVQKILQGR